MISRGMFSNDINMICGIPRIVSILKTANTVNDLKMHIDVIKSLDICHTFDEICENMDYEYTLSHISFFISELLSRIVYQEIEYSYDNDSTDFIYLFEIGRLLMSYSHVCFYIEKDEMMVNNELIKTYNKMILLNKL